ncbi:MAG: transposase, partial [Kiritimatiellae bacterium]|nr:transposase [Kiritimatiellia bacterium]
AWILRQIAHLYHIEKTLRETKAGPALRQAVRASESRMIHQRLHKAITLLAKRRILPKSKLGKAVHYALRQWPQLEHYLTDGPSRSTTTSSRTPSVPPSSVPRTGCSSATSNPGPSAPSSTPSLKTAAASASTRGNTLRTSSPVYPP